MRRMKLLFVFLLVFAALKTGQVKAASVRGTLRTDQGAPLPLVVVIAEDQRTGHRLTTVTGSAGRYRFEDLEAGEYEFSAEIPGARLSPARHVVLDGNETASLDWTLAPSPVSERVVVTATRSESATSTLGVSVSMMDRAWLEARRPATLTQALESAPGVSTSRSGGVGALSSLFLRGGESRFTRVMVDGVAVNEPGGYVNFATALPLEIERVEVVRGAVSSLYGTDALAGAVQILTHRAGSDEKLAFRAEIEGGRFDTRRASGGTTGRHGVFDWNAGVQRFSTDNQEPNSGFEQTALAVVAGARLADNALIDVALRRSASRGGTPGPTDFGRPDLDAFYDRQDTAFSTTFHGFGARLSHEARASFSTIDQLSLNPEDSGAYTPSWGALSGYPSSDYPNPEGYANDTRRYEAAYRAEFVAGERYLFSMGIDVERETGALGDRRSELLRPARTNVGAYAQNRMLVTERLYVTLGGRIERNGSYGAAAAPRLSAAWRLRGGSSSTTLRASAGVGIKEPSFTQSYGVSTFALGNPDLEPERSRTFDVGLEQRLAGDHARFEASLFHHDYRDQIAYTTLSYDPYLGTYHNLERTRARGVEVAIEAAPHRRLRLSGSYTLLAGKILTSGNDFDPIYAEGRSLLRRPKHQTFLAVLLVGSRVDGMFSLLYVGKRADSDFLGLGLDSADAYARLDATVRARVTRLAEVFATGENLLDRRYQDPLGYPALGRCLRVGLRVASGAASE